MLFATQQSDQLYAILGIWTSGALLLLLLFRLYVYDPVFAKSGDIAMALGIAIGWPAVMVIALIILIPVVLYHMLCKLVCFVLRMKPRPEFE